MNLFTKQKRLIDFKNKLLVTKGEMWERDKLRAQDKHTHTVLYKIDNQQEPTVYHRNLYPIFCKDLCLSF